jgi:ActR/RegA family two-component response regulator
MSKLTLIVLLVDDEQRLAYHMAKRLQARGVGVAVKQDSPDCRDQCRDTQ